MAEAILSSYTASTDPHSYTLPTFAIVDHKKGQVIILFIVPYSFLSFCRYFCSKDTMMLLLFFSFYLIFSWVFFSNLI